MGKTFSTGLLTNGIFQDSSNNIGIGAAANASFKLQVTGTTNLTGALSGTSATFSGNVGIGVTPYSSTALSIKGTYGLWIERGATNDSGISIYHDGTNALFSSSYQSSGAFGGMAFYTSNIQRMTITSGGIAVVGYTAGVGTNYSPPMQVKGGAGVGNGYGIISANNEMVGGIQLTSSGSNSLQIVADPDNLRASSEIAFSIDGSQKMVITSGGKVNIGIESGPNSTAFNVAGSDVSNDLGKFYINATSSLDKALLRLEKFQNNSTTSQVFVNFTINAQATANGSITANGASQVTFTAWSDRRLKENITELPNQLQNILALKPSEFDYKDGSGHQIGFIAQEMQEVYPDSVGENGQGFLTVAGWNKTEAILVKAIQELSAQVQEQNQTIQNLQEQNQDLKSRLDKAGL